MKKAQPNPDQVRELLYQALETEQGGIKIYEAALKCAINDDLRGEWQEYLEQTRTHEQVLLNVFGQLGLDPKQRPPGREVVGQIGMSLVAAIQLARKSASPEAAQLVAAECVVLAETKDHANWELIGHLVEHAQADQLDVLKQAFDAVESDEDHHLYHTKGWSRELWIQALGLPAVLPPPEELKQVETAIGAARAEQARDRML